MEQEIPKIVQSTIPIGKFPVPELNPKVISFECIEPRLQKEYRRLAKKLSFSKGELFPNKTKGAINDFLTSKEQIKLNTFETVDIVVSKGVKTLIFTAHTDCAADKAIHGERPHAEDREFQLDKLRKMYVKMTEYIKQYELSVNMQFFLFDIVGKEVSVEEVIHSLSDSEADPDSSISKSNYKQASA